MEPLPCSHCVAGHPASGWLQPEGAWDGEQQIWTHFTTAGPIYRGRSTCLLPVARRRHASGRLQVADLVVLIVVAKVSATTRRSSLAMGITSAPLPRDGSPDLPAIH